MILTKNLLYLSTTESVKSKFVAINGVSKQIWENMNQKKYLLSCSDRLHFPGLECREVTGLCFGGPRAPWVEEGESNSKALAPTPGTARNRGGAASAWQRIFCRSSELKLLCG